MAAPTRQARPAARSTAERAHDYQACQDELCPMFGCRAYKTGWRAGYAAGAAAAAAENFRAGYEAGRAAGMAAAGGRGSGR